MTESILIRSARVVSSEKIVRADVLLREGRIDKIAPRIEHGAETVIEASRLHLLPGVIDTHVHFRQPGMEWKENFRTGSRAAAAGGVTSIFDMPNTLPPTTDRRTLQAKREMATKDCIVNYNFFLAATAENIEELDAVRNIAGIKLFMGSTTGNLLLRDERLLDRLFESSKRLIAVHAEDEEIIRENRSSLTLEGTVFDHPAIRSPDAAVRAVEKALRLSRKHRRRLHVCHVTSRDEVEILEKQPKDGLVTSEACPQHFLLRAPEVYRRLGTFAQVNPPIREKYHVQALWNGLVRGVIDTIASDHAPHTRQEKERPFGEAPSGVPGVETTLPLLLNLVRLGRCTLHDVAAWLSERPALLFRAKNKGFIREGFDADLVLVDLERSRTLEDAYLETRAGWSPFQGWRLCGWPVATIVGGRIVYREGECFTAFPGKEVEIAE